MINTGYLDIRTVYMHRARVRMSAHFHLIQSGQCEKLIELNLNRSAGVYYETVEEKCTSHNGLCTVRMDCPISNATQIQIVFALAPSSSRSPPPSSRSVSVQVRCTTTSFFVFIHHINIWSVILKYCARTHSTHTHTPLLLLLLQFFAFIYPPFDLPRIFKTSLL